MSSENPAPVISTKSPILNIECEKAFSDLSTKEKLYSYYFTRASWEGNKICYFQKSYESPAMFYILQKIFQLEDSKEMNQKLLQNGFSQDEITQVFVYCAAFFQNCGNYKSFGDTKFIPQITLEKFEKFLRLSKAFEQSGQKLEEIWAQIKLEIYKYSHPYQLIEMSDQDGSTSYYSSNITKEEAEIVTKFLESEDISPLNTRVLKHKENQFEVLVCSVHKTQSKSYQFKQFSITVSYGDFAPIVKNLYTNLAQAIPYVANEEHFNSGSIDKHKDASRHWIKDKGPVVETYIGFIESYLDPLKVRAEFEGFVSIVNKEESQKLNKLVDNAEDLIQNLPWPKDFEVDVFTKPDFTSLEILSFACSGCPVGINIPNYDDIRQHEGFKNVNLGNVYGTPKKENVLFSRQNNVDLTVKYYKPSLFVIVALHELLGHGTGKLFSKDNNGKYNFDYEMDHPVTGQQIKHFYEANETWHSVFGEISSGYEECRADGVALYLSCFQQSLDILIPEYSQEEQKDIVYMAWYEIVYSAIKGLEYYDVEKKKWGQAHIRAAYALFQVMLKAGDGLISIEKEEKNGAPYIYINLNKEKIWTVGKKAVGDFLLKLQVYKSTADVIEGTRFFEEYSSVDQQMLEYRDIAIKNKLPRKVELQHDVELVGDDEDVKYVQFDQSFGGIIDSHIYHYKSSDLEPVYDLWKKHADLFRIQQGK